MHGQRTKTSRRDVGAMESKSRPTTRTGLSTEDEVPMMGMIWQDEIIKDRKKREWVAFYAGCAVGAAILAFSILFLMKLTGGVCP